MNAIVVKSPASVIIHRSGCEHFPGRMEKYTLCSKGFAHEYFGELQQCLLCGEPLHMW